MTEKRKHEAMFGNQFNKKENPKNKTINIRVTADEKAEYYEAASADGLSLSAWILGLMRKALE